MANTRFVLKEEHILLLQSMCWEYTDCETGAPAVDCKRPYGNSDVPFDVAEILDVTLPEDNDDAYREKIDEIMQFHYESHTALEIILSTQSFKPGVYETTSRNAAPGRAKWKLVK